MAGKADYHHMNCVVKPLTHTGSKPDNFGTLLRKAVTSVNSHQDDSQHPLMEELHNDLQ